ncbi:MAG: NADPH-dependent FMN reductase [Planctomycetota bacterium]|jgi:NAD(P)H-dependent FMN reductase
MADAATILAFAGSLRTGSLNKTLVRAAARTAERAGAEVTFVDLKDHPLPVYDQDLETAEGLPAAAARLKELFKAHQGLLIAAPEYNSSLSAALKNTIDWVSRPAPDEAPLECFAGKVAGLMSASPGALGGLRGLFHLRSILLNIQVIVLPEQHALSKAHEAFADDGSLKDAAQQQRVDRVAHRVVDTVRKLNA